jgi:gamma-glutamyltranspeptidase/glutathione hydrolase
VTWPEAGNIGGGGFMMVAAPTSGKSLDVQFIDYRETAPAAVKADTFSNKPSQHLLAGTPGTVRGLHLAYQRYGSKRINWSNLVMPAAKLAADGFEVDKALAASLNSGLRNTDAFPEFRRVYGKPGSTPWQAGDRLRLPELAATLAAIAASGPSEFYEGQTAGRIVEEIASGGGLISADDLRRYSAKVREPVVGTFKGHTIYAPPPPSSGGVALLQMLNMIETFELSPADRWSPSTVHVVVEAMRRAFADRARYLGDPDFGEIPVAKLIDKSYAKELATMIDRSKATPSADVAKWAQFAETGGQTTHFSVVDRQGMAVSNTYTLEQSFGGKVVVRGAGFLLNNELGDFNPRPGQTTWMGQIGTPPNIAAGGKRPLSSMTPVIVAKEGKVMLVTGSPGGRTIINTVTQVVLNRLAFGMDLRQSVDAPRLHHQWQPDGIRTEQSLQQQHPTLVEQLKQMGHAFDPRAADRQGDAHSIEVDSQTGARNGVADRRIGGSAAGY